MECSVLVQCLVFIPSLHSDITECSTLALFIFGTETSSMNKVYLKVRQSFPTEKIFGVGEIMQTPVTKGSVMYAPTEDCPILISFTFFFLFSLNPIIIYLNIIS